MKKLLTVVATLLVASVVLSAKGGLGITAGLNYNSTKIQDVQTDAKAGWSAGLTYSLNLPLGFSIQPSVLYTQKSGVVSLTGNGLLDNLLSNNVYQTTGSVIVPVSVQWGPNLLIARPFLDITPYAGYTLSNTLKGVAADYKGVVEGEKSLDYGIGVGGGLNVWKLQAIVRYNWNFGAMGNLASFTGIDGVDGVKSKLPVYGGLSVNLAYFF